MTQFLLPDPEIRTADKRRGLGALVLDGVCSQVMGSLTGGAFLVALALLMGASNVVIGVLAAIGPATQMLQLPAIFLVDWVRLRKLLVIAACFMGRLALPAIGLLPFLAPPEARVPLMLALLGAYFGLGAVAGCGFNSWMRDFVPDRLMGRFFSRRMAVSTLVGAVLSLLAGLAVDGWRLHTDYPAEGVYTLLFLVGGAAGLVGCLVLARIPEPRMPPRDDRGLFQMVAAPFKHANFRRLIMFLGSWNFAVSLAGPFFVVYMLVRVELSMTAIILLAVGAQLVNVVFFGIWGRLADRFSNKSVLGVSGVLFVLVFLMWPFVTMPDPWWATIPLLIAIHVFSGMSAAGVALCTGNIALKLAPKGQATPYLAANALVCGLAATVAPILGGLLADFFELRRLSLRLHYEHLIDPGDAWMLPAFELQGLDFLFVIAFVAGLYALHRLPTVAEPGEVARREVVLQLYREARRGLRDVSNIEGLRMLTYFPYAALSGVVGAFRDSRGNKGPAKPRAEQRN